MLGTAVGIVQLMELRFRHAGIVIRARGRDVGSVMNAVLPALRRVGAWYDPRSAQGVVGLQAALNGFMLSALILLHASPWLALAALLVLFAATVTLHGREHLTLFATFGALGWGAEAWVVGVGGVWQFSFPTSAGVDGGLFGVPFFMAPAWALTGAIMLALARWLGPDRR